MIKLSADDWTIENIDTILFDKDGTFIDLHYFWGKMTEMRVQEVIKRFNLLPEITDKLCLCLGYDKKNKKMIKDGITAMYSRAKIIEIFQHDLENMQVKVLPEQLEEIFDAVSLKFYNEINEYTKPIESAVEFIKTLHSKKKNIKLGIVTSDSIHSTNLTLKHYDWEKYFQVVIGRESSPEGKESGIPVKMALKKLNSKPEHTIMIGDAPTDFLAAKNAGLHAAILVATGQIELNDLRSYCKSSVETLKQINFE